jgi:phosphatidate cytidylyltransferase
VADDNKGDDLFEDLDKFFAPIKDVDWDEPEETAAPVPHEEHVAVRADEAPDETTTDVVGDDWDDVGTIEVGEVPGDDDEPGGRGVDEVTIIDEEPGDDADQAGLFEPPAQEADLSPAAGFWDDHDDQTTSEEPELATPSADEGSPDDDEPTEAELEAAAEHFAGMVRQERYDTEPVDLGDEPSSGVDVPPELDDADAVERDILSDLQGQQEVPAVIVGTEGITGPSWQEPASVEVGADLERRGPDAGERDVPAAFLTGTILAGVAVASLLIGPAAFATVATVIVLLAQGELFGVMVRHRHQPATAVGLTTGALMMVGAYQRGVVAIPAMFVLGVIATFLWYLTVPAMQRKNIMLNAGLTVLNIAWIPFLAGYLIALSKEPDGRELVIAVVGLTYLYDTAAFMSGTVVGGAWLRRGMAPATSPKKSWEGLLIATVFTVFISVALVTSFVAPFNERRVDTMLLGLVVVAAATLGDLAESLIKRDLDVKDMSTLLPGHGGVLDRIDSLLFVAPAAYLLLGAIDII